MAGSRLEKFGTVFTRVRDLMRAGVIKKSDKPIWYDVYEAFPPKRDPVYVKPMDKIYGKKRETVQDIFYPEDAIRAKFYEMYGTGPRAFELSNPNFVSTCQRFVEKYTELESRGEVEEASLFEETGRAMLAEGVLLRRGKRGSQVAPDTSSPALRMSVKEMLAEQQTDAPGEAPPAEAQAADSEETPSQKTQQAATGPPHTPTHD